VLYAHEVLPRSVACASWRAGTCSGCGFESLEVWGVGSRGTCSGCGFGGLVSGFDACAGVCAHQCMRKQRQTCSAHVYLPCLCAQERTLRKVGVKQGNASLAQHANRPWLHSTRAHTHVSAHHPTSRRKSPLQHQSTAAAERSKRPQKRIDAAMSCCNAPRSCGGARADSLQRLL
jgi:hypothetical protein